MTMDHNTVNIDVGDSINIQRTDGKCENNLLFGRAAVSYCMCEERVS